MCGHVSHPGDAPLGRGTPEAFFAKRRLHRQAHPSSPLDMSCLSLHLASRRMSVPAINKHASHLQHCQSSSMWPPSLWSQAHSVDILNISNVLIPLTQLS